MICKAFNKKHNNVYYANLVLQSTQATITSMLSECGMILIHPNTS